MKQTPATAVGRHLVWLVLQSWVLLPMVVGQLTVESWADSPWAFRLIDSLLFVVVGFFVVRNLVRLWRAPACEASGRTVLSLTLVGVLFTIAATGPLLESDRWSTKPLGVAAALVGAALLTLGVRDAFRMRSLRSRLAAQHEQPPRSDLIRETHGHAADSESALTPMTGGAPAYSSRPSRHSFAAVTRICALLSERSITWPQA